MSKKRKVAESGVRRLVQPIPLDSTGRPVFPIVLGGLTVYSLGEVSAGWSESMDLARDGVVFLSRASMHVCVQIFMRMVNSVICF